MSPWTRSAPFCVLLWSAPLFAQTTDPPKDKSKDDDVVFDNRTMSEEQKAKKKEENAQLFENDTPFASTTPDPVATRENKWEPGFVFGGRFGYMSPSGNMEAELPFTLFNDGQIFIWGDLGYAPIPHLFLGLYLSAGYVLPDDCGEEATCTGWDLRGGPEVIVRFLPFTQISPMLGVGMGYEWMTQSAATDDASVRVTRHGLELLNVQLGVDVRRRDEIYGVFLMYSLGRFTKESIDSDITGERSGSIDDPAIHNWLGIGVRGVIE
jgi:hypothetical protein